MKKLKLATNKILSVFLSIVIVLSVFSGIGLTAAAATANNPHFNKIADSSTMDGWKEFFGSTYPSTENAGAVWTDKSVFTDASQFTELTDAYNQPITPSVTDRSFLVALSAIASNKSIVGYSHIPTDTVLVLDVSGSMGPVPRGQNPDRYNDAVAELVLAANAAVDTLLNLNQNNRVGVVIYSSSGSQFLNVDRYTATGTITYDNETPNDTSDDRKIGEYFVANNNRNEISVANGVKNSNNQTVRGNSDISGATYIQDGLMETVNVFKGISDARDTVIGGDDFQSGTQRKPVVVLMSDGAPTYASTDYKNLSSRNLGSGSSTSQHYAFVTQLTAAYAKQKITEYYNGSEALFYTLGLGVGNDAVAKSTLDPANSTPTIAGYWQDYQAATNGSNLNLVNNANIKVDSSITDINYSDGYYAADTKVGLFGAFQKIVDQIIIQSLYRPTLVEENNANMEGYIEFIDDIGDYMHVHSIEGIMIGDKLYTGQKLAENFREGGGELGTVTSPNDLGNHLIWSVQQRLGISDVEVARNLVKLAYEDGQLSYNQDGTYSNYIGWYADENGSFMGFWDKDDTYSNIPTNNGKTAKYVNKSYGMLGEIKLGLNTSDLMYVSIQVHTEIADKTASESLDTDLIKLGHSQLIFRVPASLIPVTTYSIELEGTNYENARNIEMTVTNAEPIRLLFEVGLRHDINEYNIEEALADSGTNHKGTDGKYRFYTNQYSVEQFNNEIDADNPQYIEPTSSINTLSYFEPNLANERYYYTEPTPIYVKNPDGSYSKYSSANKPVYADDTYFRKLNVFKYTDATNDGNAAILIDNDTSYEEISKVALEKAVKSDTNGGWNIPKDVIHRVYDHVSTKKSTNKTNTLDYSFYLAVEHLEGVHYYSDAILGNNGLLTVTPATGISITKTVDASLLGTTEEFEFKISKLDAAGRRYNLILRDQKGNFTTVEGTHTFDANGDTTIKLQAGYTAYLTDLISGDYTVTEVIPQDANYEAIEKPTEPIKVNADSITPTSFKNALKESGFLVIAKEVTHPFGTAPDSLSNKEFTFEVTLSNGNETYPDAEADYYYTSNATEINKATVDNNKLQVKLKADDSAVIKIRDGWTVAVVEKNLPSGFTQTNVSSSHNKTVTTSHNVLYDFVNNYAPSATQPNITLEASKQLTGKPWTNDTFTFIVSRYDVSTASFVKIGEETVNAPTNTDTVNFGNALKNAINQQRFTQVGSYHFSISEVIPTATKGITYDALTRDFHIIVADEDTDGSLEIISIEAANRTTINNNLIIADKFVNSYKADGIAEVTLEIQKNVDVPTGADAYSPEGFEFGLYDNLGNLIGDLQNTDENGEAQFVLTFNADNVSYNNNKVYNYTIKESKPALAGMTYAQDIPVTITVKDNLDGTISATSNVGTLNNDGAYSISVTNSYAPDATTAQITVNVNKTVNNTGTDKIGPEGFKFEIADATSTLGTVTSDQNGNAQFSIKFTPENIGTTLYTVKEVDEGKPHTTYSDKVYTFNVTVNLDANNKLIATVTSDENIVNGSVVTAAFENTYSNNLPEVKIDSIKTQSVNGKETTDKAVQVNPGDIVTYSITLTNNGEIASNAITVRDKIPQGLKIVSGSITENGILTDDTITWNIDSIEIGKTITVSFKVTVPEVEENTIWKNIALVVYDKDHDDTPDNPEDSNTVELIFELPSAPKTADITNLNLWLALLFISGGSLSLIAIKKNKKLQENN